MNKKRPHEPMLVHGVHVFYRGEGHHLGDSVSEAQPLIEQFIFTHDVGYTDRDSLYLFYDFKMSLEYRPVDQFTYFDADGHKHDRRVFAVVDRDNNIKYTLPLSCQFKS